MTTPNVGRIRLVAVTILSKLTIWAIGTYAICQGLGIVWGGPARFGGPAYKTLRTVPWEASTFWGIALTVGGVAILIGSVLARWWLKTIGLVGVAIWSLLLANGAWDAMQANPVGGTTGAATYVFIAGVSLILVFVHEEEWHAA